LSITPIMPKPFEQGNVHPLPALSDWSQLSNPAVRELLDHVADELAKEYIRLMEASAEREVGK